LIFGDTAGDASGDAPTLFLFAGRGAPKSRCLLDNPSNNMTSPTQNNLDRFKDPTYENNAITGAQLMELYPISNPIASHKEFTKVLEEVRMLIHVFEYVVGVGWKAKKASFARELAPKIAEKVKRLDYHQAVRESIRQAPRSPPYSPVDVAYDGSYDMDADELHTGVVGPPLTKKRIEHRIYR
jgi:hypothetical protein